MTDGAGNCATARASLSLEDLDNEMRRAIPRPVHHNEFFSQRWAIFAPPLFFARLPAIRSAPQRGRTAKVKALLGRVLSEGQLRHQAQQPSTSLRRGAARGVRRKIVRNLAFFGSVSAEKISRHLIFGGPMVIVLARLILSETL